MVTRKSSPSEQSTVEVRIIDFKLTGSDDALRESLQTISNAFGGQNVQVKRSSTTARPTQIQASGVNSAGEAEPEEELDADDVV
jgi:hypothetical protein